VKTDFGVTIEDSEENQALLQEVQKAYRAQAQGIQVRKGKDNGKRPAQAQKAHPRLWRTLSVHRNRQETGQEAHIPCGVHDLQGKILFRHTKAHEKSRTRVTTLHR